MLKSLINLLQSTPPGCLSIVIYQTRLVRSVAEKGNDYGNHVKIYFNIINVLNELMTVFLYLIHGCFYFI